jgi:hypothetical protein
MFLVGGSDEAGFGWAPCSCLGFSGIINAMLLWVVLTAKQSAGGQLRLSSPLATIKHVTSLPESLHKQLSLSLVLCCAANVQGLEQLASGTVPLPGAAAAVDSATSMFGGWGSWLGMSTGAPTATAADAATGSPLARKGSSMSNVSSHSKLGV